MSKFIQDCINGDALLSDIDDYIDSWSETETDLPLHDFLGMTKKEYSLFVQDEDYLASIVTAHKKNISIEEIMEEHIKLAARSDSQAKSQMLERWLKDEGLWE